MEAVEFPFLQIFNNRLDIHLALDALGIVYTETE